MEDPKWNWTVVALMILLAAGAARSAGEGSITVRADRAGPDISRSMYGLFYEEINHAGNGGLYAEMIRNRSFEEPLPIEGCTLVDGVCIGPDSPNYRSGQNKDWRVPWSFPTPWPFWSLDTRQAEAALAIETNDTVHPKNANYLRLDVRRIEPGGAVRLLNEGYWGVAVKAGETYDGSFFARVPRGNFEGRVTVGVADAAGRVLGSAEVAGVAGAAWKKYTASFTVTATDPKAVFFLQPDAAGVLDLDVISLFPRNTFRNRPNGLRADLAQLLADLKPAFLRFPGGCVVEGATFANRYRWKETIGPIETRPGHWSLWRYRDTDGLGYHEFLQLCEDLKCDALYVANAGLSCTYSNGDYLPEERLGEIIQDILDAVEYALGGPDTRWGAERVKNGHPAPFPLKYLEIGNENYGPIYDRYFHRIAKAVRDAWPQVVLIGNTRNNKAPIVDEHFYRDPAWMFEHFSHYDQVPRDRPYKVYAGEYACNKQVGSGNLLAALSEAAFMMGMERNGDVVIMASYAPLFFNVHDIKWPVNMIGFDAAGSFARTTYYVQKMFTDHRPDTNLATAVTPPAEFPKDRFFATAGLDRATGEILLKVLNGSDRPCAAKVRIEGADAIRAGGRQILLTGKLDEENSLARPRHIVPVERPFKGLGADFTLEVPAASVMILRIPAGAR